MGYEVVPTSCEDVPAWLARFATVASRSLQVTTFSQGNWLMYCSGPSDLMIENYLPITLNCL